MQNRSSRRRKKDHDASVTAFRVVHEATQEDTAEEHPTPDPTPEERHAAAVALGRLGGRKGGKARAAKLTPEQLFSLSRYAAQARWGNRQDR